MKTLVAICMVLFVFGCAQPQVKPETKAPAPDTIQLNVPNWPVIGYTNADQTAYLILLKN